MHLSIPALVGNKTVRQGAPYVLPPRPVAPRCHGPCAKAGQRGCSGALPPARQGVARTIRHSAVNRNKGSVSKMLTRLGTLDSLYVMAQEPERDKGDAAKNAPGLTAPEKDAPGLTAADLIWRVFGETPVRPGVYLGFLLGVILIWASGRAETRDIECAFAVFGCFALGVSVLVFFYDVRQSRAAPPLLKRRFRIGKFDPDEWRVALRLPGAGAFRASGFILFKPEKEGGTSEYRDYARLQSFLLEIAGKGPYAARLDRGGRPQITLRVQNARTLEVYEQIGVTFWWDTDDSQSPQHAEIEIGYEMPPERREALLKHVAQRVATLGRLESDTATLPPGSA